MSNSKKAIKTTLIFALVLIIFHIGIFECFFQTENYTYQDYRERKEMSGTIDYVILGSSHATWALDPRVIDEKLGVNSYNLGNEWISMKTRYNLLQYELARNPIKTVVLEVSYDSISSTDTLGDLFVLSRWENPWQRIKFFFTSFRPNQYKDVYNFCFSNGMSSLEWMIKKTGHKYQSDPRVYKGYFGQDSTNVAAEDYRALYHTDPAQLTINEENVAYMQKIVDLCKENDINIVLVSIPYSKTLICKRSYWDDYKNWYDNFAKENGLTYLDFNLLKNRDTLFPDETAFINEEHLGGSAAEQFTGIYTDMLTRVANGEDLSNEFFDSYKEYEQSQDFINP